MIRLKAALFACAVPITLAACSGGGAMMSSPGAAPVSDARTLHGAAANFRVTNSLTGQMGLPPDFRGVATAVRETSPGWLSEEAKGSGPKLYISDDSANAVYIYNAVRPTTPIGTITSGISGPVGNFVDAQGSLYVANLGNSVTVYAKGKTVPAKTYTVGLSEPTSVVVGNDGAVYVSEFPKNSIVEYAPGKMTPTRTIALNAVQGVALDSNNNLYASYANPATGSGGVEKFKPNASKGVDLGILLGMPGDLKLDRANDLLVEDQTSDVINFYKPGAKTPYGSITAQYTPFKLAFNAPEKLLYVATGINALDIFDAVPGGKLYKVLMSGLQSTSGVSLSPPPPLAQ